MKKLKLFFCFLVISSSINSQVDTSDFAIWSSIGLNYSPVKKLKLAVEQNWRLKEDASVTDDYFTEVSIQYEIIKDFEITGGARFIKENDNVGKKQGFESHFRYNVDASFKYDIDRFTVSHRIRYQNKKELNLSETETNIPKETIRFKTDLAYNIRKWPLDPSFSIELFSDLDENIKQIRDLSLESFRITFGTDYNWKNIGKFGFYYRYQENILTYFKNTTINILGLGYTYSFK